MKDGKGRYSDIAPARRDAEFNRAIVLARIFGASPHGWVLKGGNALLWRDTKARATRDIDLFSTQSTIQDAHKALQDILIRNPAHIPPNDVVMRLREKGNIVMPGDKAGRKLQVAILSKASGAPVCSPIDIDLVVGDITTAPYESYPGNDLAEVFDVPEMPNISLYPLVDHIADKVTATMQVYPGMGHCGSRSTRIKDLVDIPVLAQQSLGIRAADLYKALEAKRLENNLDPYCQGLIFPENWNDQEYRKLIAKSVDEPQVFPESYSQAQNFAQNFLDQVMKGELKEEVWNGEAWV